MKLSISLPPVDVEFLDAYARKHGAGSRSATLQQAIKVLRAAELGDAYEQAWSDWADEADLWDTAVADGLPRT